MTKEEQRIVNEDEIQQYRERPDPDNRIRNTLITKHLGMVRKIAARFISPKYSRDDVNELAYFELVQAVIRAKKSLKDNNIRPYIIKCVRLRLLQYVSLDHLLMLPSSYGSQSWDKKNHQTRLILNDSIANQLGVEEHVMLSEILQKSVTSEDQSKVVELRFEGYKFIEISEKTGINLKACQRLWYEYQETVKGNYGQETMPDVYGRDGDARCTNMSKM